MLAYYPGVFRDTLTYLNERIEEVLTGAEGAHRRAGLRPGSEAPSRPRRRRSSKIIAGIEGVGEHHVDLQVDEPQIEVEVNLAKARPSTA